MVSLKGEDMKVIAITLAAVSLIGGATAVFAATDAKTKTASVKSPESIECSKQADAKGLHGQERKKFRAECKKELKAKTSTTTAATPPASSGEAKTDSKTDNKTTAPTKTN